MEGNPVWCYLRSFRGKTGKWAPQARGSTGITPSSQGRSLGKHWAMTGSSSVGWGELETPLSGRVWANPLCTRHREQSGGIPRRKPQGGKNTRKEASSLSTTVCPLHRSWCLIPEINIRHLIRDQSLEATSRFPSYLIITGDQKTGRKQVTIQYQ